MPYKSEHDQYDHELNKPRTIIIPQLDLPDLGLPLMYHQKMSDKEWEQYHQGRAILKQAIEYFEDWRNWDKKSVCISADFYKAAFNEKVKYYLSAPQWPHEPEIWNEDAFKDWIFKNHNIKIIEHFGPGMYEPEYYLCKITKP
jgi:hypothetical protein